MGLFRRKSKSKTESEEEIPPEAPDILGPQNRVFCTIFGPWKWVLEKYVEEAGNLTVVEEATKLPTGIVAAARNKNQDESSTPPKKSRRRNKKTPGPCTLRLEVCDNQGKILEAVHGTSEAFDGLGDKDELFRTMQRCRCDNLHLTPPSALINWDVTEGECKNLVGDSLPTLLGTENEERIAVLKDPMGTSGAGVFFVRNAAEIHKIIDENRKRATSEPDFLDNLIAAKGRIPSWGKFESTRNYRHGTESHSLGLAPHQSCRRK